MLNGDIELTKLLMRSNLDLRNPKTLYNYQPSKALQTINKDWFLVAGSHRFKVNSISVAIENINVPTLATYKKYQGHEKTFAVLAKLVLFVLKMVNVKSTANDFQVIGICEMILDDYYFLKLSEIRYCFNRGLSGKYKKEGKLFGKIDITDFSNWLDMYSNERSQFLIKNRESEASKAKSLSSKPISKAVVDKIKETLKHTQVNSFSSLESSKNNLELRIEKLTKSIEDYNKVLDGGNFKGLYTSEDKDGKPFQYDFEAMMKETVKQSEIKLTTLKKALKQYDQNENK